MTKASNLKLVSADRTPARAALAKAIDRLAEVDGHIAEIKVAQIVAAEVVGKARTAVTAAEEVMATAQANVVQHSINVAMGRNEPAPISVKEARHALEDAEEELHAAKAVEFSLREVLEEATRSRPNTCSILDMRVLGVVRADANPAALVREFKELQREFVSRRRVLEFLEGKRALPEEFSGWRSEANLSGEMADAAWRAALTALETNPDTELPE